MLTFILYKLYTVDDVNDHGRYGNDHGYIIPFQGILLQRKLLLEVVIDIQLG